MLTRLSRIDVLVIDDWAMAPLAETERRDFWEICEDRYQARSTILTSQLPVARWHEQSGDPTAADGILDRLVQNKDNTFPGSAPHDTLCVDRVDTAHASTIESHSCSTSRCRVRIFPIATRMVKRPLSTV